MKTVSTFYTSTAVLFNHPTPPYLHDIFTEMSTTVRIKEGIPYSKAHCSKVNRFENLHVAYKWRATHPLSIHNNNNNNNGNFYSAHIYSLECSRRWFTIIITPVTGSSYNTARNNTCTISTPWGAYKPAAMNQAHKLRSFTKAFASYRVPIYTPGWRAAMWIKCLAEGQKVPGYGRESNPEHSDSESRVQSNIPRHLHGTFLSSGMSHMTEYIANEDDNVMTHFLQVFVIGKEDCSECCYWQFRWTSALFIFTWHTEKVWVIIASYQSLFWSTNSCQIRLKDPQEHKEKLQAPCYSNFSRKEMITWHEIRQFQQPHHYTVCQWHFYPIVKTCKKWVMTLSSSMDRLLCLNNIELRLTVYSLVIFSHRYLNSDSINFKTLYSSLFIGLIYLNMILQQISN